jgi:outer membrane lipoprotein-sorting protein
MAVENRKNLDERIKRAISSGRVEFDFESWKKQNPDSVKLLLSYAESGKEDKKGFSISLRFLFRERIFRLSVAAAAVVILVLLFGRFNGGRSNLAFGEILAIQERIQTLHAKKTIKGKPYEIWMKRPNMMRMEDGSGSYLISRADEMWFVDEPNRTVTKTPLGYLQSTHTLRGEIDIIDILIQADYANRYSGYLSEGPSGQVNQGGKIYDVYRMETRGNGGVIKFEALVEAQTHIIKLVTIKGVHDSEEEEVYRFEMLESNQPIQDSFFVYEPNDKFSLIIEQKEPLKQVPGKQDVGATLSGRVVWASSKKPVVGAKFLVTAGDNKANGNREFVGNCQTNSEGYWEIFGVPPGVAEISVKSWRLDWPAVPQFSQNIGLSVHPSIVVDGKGEYRNLDFKVYKAEELFARITIDVQDEDGKPIEGVSAYLQYCDRNEEHQSIYASSIKRTQFTDSNGCFDSADIWPTERPVQIFIVTKNRFGSVYAARRPLTKPFVIEPKGDYHFDIVLPFVREMKVQVVDTNKRQLKGVCVSVIDKNGELIYPLPWLNKNVFTDSQGLADVNGMSPEEEVLIALKRLHADSNDSRNFTASTIIKAKAPLGRDEKPILRCVFDERPVCVRGSIDYDKTKNGVIYVMVAGQPGQWTLPFMWKRLEGASDFELQAVPADEIRLLYSYVTGDTNKRIEKKMITEPGCTYTVKISDRGIEIVNQQRGY